MPSVKTKGAIRLSLGTTFVAGAARERVKGLVLLRLPRGWPRTSPVGSEPTTFGPLQIGRTDCTAHIYLWPRVVATSHPAAYIAEEGGRGPAVDQGVKGTHRWQIRASDTSALVAHGTATSIQRIAPHRYAGVRVDAVFSPRCPPELARDTALLRTLRNALTTIKVRASTQRG